MPLRDDGTDGAARFITRVRGEARTSRVARNRYREAVTAVRKTVVGPSHRFCVGTAWRRRMGVEPTGRR